MRRVLAVIVVLGLGLGLVWLLDPGSPTPPRASGSDTSEGTGFGAASGELQNAEFGGEATSGGDPSSLLPVVREEGAPADLHAPGPHVLVVRGADQQPVPNAEVFFLQEGQEQGPRGGDLQQFLRQERGASRVPPSRWEAPELWGRRTRTDERGMAQLPSGPTRWLCSAQKDAEFGFLVLPARAGNHTIQLQPDEEVQIHVSYQAPKLAPAPSVPVAVQHEYRNNRASEVWRGVTDTNGKAIVRHFQLLRRVLGDNNPAEFQERFAAIALLPTSPPTCVEFAGRPATSQPVLLELPAMGSLLATLVDHGGKPLRSPASIRFAANDAARERGAFPLNLQTLRQTMQKPAGIAPVALPFAQVGQPVQLSARYPHSRRSGKNDAQPGPQNQGEVVAVAIPPLPSHAVFAGRLLLPDGRAVAQQQVAVTIWREDAVDKIVDASTTSDGQWDLVIDGNADQARWRMEFRYLWQASSDTVEGRPVGPATWLGHIVAVAALPPGQRTDIGTITLQPLPALVAGIVVDDLGQPVAGAAVSIEQERPARDAPAANRVRSNGPDLRILVDGGSLQLEGNGWRRNQNAPRWRSLRHLAGKSEADGTFAIFAPLPSGNLRVLADGKDHFSATLPLSGPSSNLRLVLPRNGILTGRVLVPEWLADGAVTVTLQPTQTASDGKPPARNRDAVANRIHHGNGGKFVLQPIRPGRYDVLVQMRNLPTEMAAIRDVLVQPGHNQDPRLEPLDVRQSLYRYKLRAFQESGQPFALDGPIHARFPQPDGSFQEAGFRWRKGVAELITVQPSVELTFFGRGFEPMKQQYGPGEHEVFLKTLQPAMVNLPGARALSGPTRKVRISALLQGDTGLPASLNGTDQLTGEGFSFPRWDLGRTSGGWLEQTDLVAIPLMQAGSYQLLFRAHANETTNTAQTSVTLGTFELKPDGTTITTVPLNSQQISDALRTLDKQHEERMARNNQRNR